MLIQYFSESCYDTLFSNIDNNRNLDFYNGTGDSALSSIINLPEDLLTSNVDLPMFKLINPPDNAGNSEKNANDITNIKQVYDAWKDLTPLQASNKYLWTYYCHRDDYKEYIQKRWRGDAFSPKQVESRFFVFDNKRNLVRENALSSLWWKGYLTYDSSADNPFWIAETLDITNFADFLDTFNSYNPTRAKGVIKAINTFQIEYEIEHFKIFV